VFAEQDGPAFMAGAFEAVTAFWLDADFLKSRLGKHEMISEMEIRAALPRTPVGKLSKKESYDEINAKAAAAKAAP